MREQGILKSRKIAYYHGILLQAPWPGLGALRAASRLDRPRASAQLIWSESDRAHVLMSTGVHKISGFLGLVIWFRQFQDTLSRLIQGYKNIMLQ